MNKFIEQCKGLDADKVTVSNNEMFYCSIKYDGIYIQIQKTGDKIFFLLPVVKSFLVFMLRNF